jgi:hypothetical protein
MSQVRVDSSTDSQADVEQAATAEQGDQLVRSEGYGTDVQSAERDGVTVESTTESRRQLEQAFKPQQRGPHVASTTDQPEEVEAVQKDLDEERQQRTDEYLGKSNRKLLRQISRLTGQRYSRDETIAELRAQLAQFQGTPAEAEQSTEPSPQQEPAPQQYQAPPQQGVSQQEAQVVERWLQDFERAKAQWPAKAAEAAQRLPDLREALNKLDSENPVSLSAAVHIAMLPNPMDVGYYLAHHPSTVARLWSMDGSQGMINELNKISAGLEFSAQHSGESNGRRTQSTQRRTPPALPRPISPVGGTFAGSANRNPEHMDYQEYREWRNRGGK